MAESDFAQEFADYVDGNIVQMKHLADRARALFILLRLGLVVGSASLPALTAFADQRLATGFAIGVAILAGLDTQFRWGEEWRHFRSAQLTLERLRRDYRHGLSSVQAGRTTDSLASAGDVFEHFYQGISQFLQVEQDSFFKFRVVEWKKP